jgi:SAM-dependent methyltransferase
MGNRKIAMSQESKQPMRVKDIRPAELRQLQADAYARDVARLRDRLDEFVAVACPACGADQPVPTFTKFDFNFSRCRACRTLYMSPRPTPELMSSYYGSSENYRVWAEHIFPASEESRRERIHRPMLEFVAAACERHNVARGKLVEIGPGFGTFAALAQDSAMFGSVLVIERTPEMADACRARGLTVIEQAVEDVPFQQVGKADVVVSFEVIEHLFDPTQYLRSTARLLPAGGLLLLTCPNGEGFDTAMLGALSVAVDSEHVNLFNAHSLAVLLERCGFEVLEQATPGRLDAELVREAVLAGQLDISANPFLRTVLVEEWERLGQPFQAFLAANGLSGHLRTLARKA